MKNATGISLEHLVRETFLDEVRALKPGNVSRYAGGHGMSYEHFARSADICSPVLCDAGLGVGERVLSCVTLTREAVGCNTNLGMLLLFSPIIKSYETTPKFLKLKAQVKMTLELLDFVDAENIYRGIRLANPGGLGRVEQHDVNFSPDISVLEAMQYAADRDLVARQYVTCFDDVFGFGMDCLREFAKRWNSVEWATVACYLGFLAGYPDSHIRRKHGGDIARRVQKRAVPVFEQFKNNNNPAVSKQVLLEFDRELKDTNINPGTCADLTAASLLLYRLYRGNDGRS